MTQIFSDFKTEVFTFLNYLKSPFEHFNEKLSFNEKWKIFSILIFFQAVFTFAIVIPLFYFVELFISLKYRNDLNNFNIYILLILGSFFVPFIEEIIFRLPLKWQRNYILRFLNQFSAKDNFHKIWNRFYAIFFYIFALIFGAIHLSNFENQWTAIFVLLAPIIVLSQIMAGLILGFIRNRLGFFWSIAYHGIFNFCALLLPYLIYHEVKIINIDEKDRKIILVNMETNETGKVVIEKNIQNDTVYFYNAENLNPTIFFNEITPGFYSDDIELLNFKLISEKGVSRKELAGILRKELDLQAIKK